MNKRFYIPILLIFYLGTVFTACKNDDDDFSQEESIGNVTDCVADGLYGNVKTIDETYYYNTQWLNDNSIKKGFIECKNTTTYTTSGYCKEIITYSNSISGFIQPSQKTTITIFDKKNRPLEQVSEYYSTEGTAKPMYIRTTYTYNDKEKEAIATEEHSNDGKKYTKTLIKIIYKLKDDGRIDYENYTVYGDSSLKSVIDTIPEDEPVYTYETVQEKDSHGNWIKQYNKATSNKSDDNEVTVLISNYIERIISYY